MNKISAQKHGFLTLEDMKTYKLSKTLTIKTSQVRKKRQTTKTGHIPLANIYCF